MVNLLKDKLKFLNLSLKGDTNFTILLVLAFLSLALIGLLHHEMWRDELHAWMIARDSSSFSELFSNLRYEGHPILWHVCLYLLSRLTRNPLAMQLFHLAIATGLVYLFCKFSPFTKLQKILFTFSYFPLYEYGIISRNYNIGVLIIFLFCTFFPTRYKSYLILSSILAILANTNAFTFIFAFGLAATLAFEIIINKSNYQLFPIKKWDLILSATIYMAGAIVALIQIIPPSDSEYTGDREQVFQPSEVRLINVVRLAKAINRISKVYVPIPKPFEYRFWSSSIFVDHLTVLKVAGLGLSLCLLVISITLFLRKPVILFMYLCITCGFLLFHYVKFMGTTRHSGYLFILLLACFWISNDTQTISLKKELEKITGFLNRYKNHYLTALLTIHVIVAIFAFSMDLKYPFSASKETANFIESNRLKDTLTVGHMDMPVSTIAALLDKEIYYPESNNFGTFVKWNQRKRVTQKEIIDKTAQLIEVQNSPNALLILNKELDRSNVERLDISISELFHSTRSLVRHETYHLYLIKRNPVGGQAKG